MDANFFAPGFAPRTTWVVLELGVDTNLLRRSEGPGAPSAPAVLFDERFQLIARH